MKHKDIYDDFKLKKLYGFYQNIVRTEHMLPILMYTMYTDRFSLIYF